MNNKEIVYDVVQFGNTFIVFNQDLGKPHSAWNCKVEANTVCKDLNKHAHKFKQSVKIEINPDAPNLRIVG